MSGLEWAHADAGVSLILSDEDAGDGNTPDKGEVETGNIALLVDHAVIYGQPGEVLELLADSIAMISAHLAGQPTN